MFQARGLLQDTLSATSWCLCSFGGRVIYSPKIYVLPIEIYFRDSTSQFSFSVHLDLSDTQRVELLISQEKSSQVTQPRLSSLEKNLSLSQEELHLLWRTLTYLSLAWKLWVLSNPCRRNSSLRTWAAWRPRGDVRGLSLNLPSRAWDSVLWRIYKAFLRNRNPKCTTKECL